MKIYQHSLLTALSAVAIVGSYSLPSYADDDAVKQGLEEAKAAYAQRSAMNSDSIDRALSKLASLEGTADDSDLNYDVLILESRCFYWKGVHQTSNDQKMNFHDLGIKMALKAKEVNDGYAEAYYFAGINLARWGEAKGVIASLTRKGELEAYMKQTMSHPTREDQLGETIDGYGPNRVLGRMYFVLPGLFGGSHSQSVKLLEKAYSQAQNLALNVVYYAETLNGGNSSEKALAKKVLDQLLANDPQTYNPSRVPENLEEFEMARKLRSQL